MICALPVSISIGPIIREAPPPTPPTDAAAAATVALVSGPFFADDDTNLTTSLFGSARLIPIAFSRTFSSAITICSTLSKTLSRLFSELDMADEEATLPAAPAMRWTWDASEVEATEPEDMNRTRGLWLTGSGEISIDVAIVVPDVVLGGVNGSVFPLFVFTTVLLAWMAGEICFFLCRMDVGAFAFAPPPMMVFPLACLGEVGKRNCWAVAGVVDADADADVVVKMGLALFPCWVVVVLLEFELVLVIITRSDRGDRPPVDLPSLLSRDVDTAVVALGIGGLVWGEVGSCCCCCRRRFAWALLLSTATRAVGRLGSLDLTTGWCPWLFGLVTSVRTTTTSAPSSPDDASVSGRCCCPSRFLLWDSRSLDPKNLMPPSPRMPMPMRFRSWLVLLLPSLVCVIVLDTEDNIDISMNDEWMDLSAGLVHGSALRRPWSDPSSHGHGIVCTIKGRSSTISIYLHTSRSCCYCVWASRLPWHF